MRLSTPKQLIQAGSDLLHSRAFGRFENLPKFCVAQNPRQPRQPRHIQGRQACIESSNTPNYVFVLDLDIFQKGMSV